MLLLDYIALSVFAICWLGYACFSERSISKTDNIVRIMHDFRSNWMENCAFRKERGEDVVAVGQLIRTVTFFASTTIIVIAVLAPLYKYADVAQSLFGAISFVHISPSPIWELKVTIIEILFIYAFFKCTWSLRQYNYSLIMILAMPHYNKVTDEARRDIDKNAAMLTNAARHFSLAIRGFYFGLITLGWFFHPLLFIALNFLVVWVIYRREFLSKAFGIVHKTSKHGIN